jgi:zinc transport system substrate-binding protein
MDGARKWALIGAVSASWVFAAQGARGVAAELEVAASIAPVHSLVAAVMGERGTSALLLPGGQSEHSTVLRPSTAQAIARARLVFRIARGFESALDKPLSTLAGDRRVVELARSRGAALLGARTVEEDEAPIDLPRAGPLVLWADLHVWLDPVFARAMTEQIVRSLSEADPAGAAVYAANGARQAARLEALDAELALRLRPVSDVPFMVFHDAYQYFERRYDLNEVGRVEVSPERPPSARHLSRLRKRIKTAGAVCVFAEPQIEPRVLPTLTEGLKVRIGVLDPLGAELTPGPELYFVLLRRLANALATCLQP